MTSDLSFIHRFVPSPDGEGSHFPTLLLLHGTGGNENDLLDLGRALAPNANLLSPRGQVMENGMPRFFRRHAEGVFDLEDLKLRTDHLAGFIAQACSRYQLDREKLVAVGYSNGANIAAGTLLRHPRVLTGAVLFRAMIPYQPEEVPDLSGKRILMLSGSRDPIVPQETVRALEELFRKAGADLTHHADPAAGHGLTGNDLASAREWLK